MRVSPPRWASKSAQRLAPSCNHYWRLILCLENTLSMMRFAYLILILLMTLAAGAMAFSALLRSVRGDVRPVRCPGCGALNGQVNVNCRACGDKLDKE